MNNILKEILENKKKEVELNKIKIPLKKLKEKLGDVKNKRDFEGAVSRKDKINIIAEIKKASPSLGIIKADFDYVNIAKEYETGGAAAISVLTEESRFKGSLGYINEIKKNVALPILRKDFLFDVYQVFESRVFGADALLLIAAILDKKTLTELVSVAKDIGLDVLVEVHNEKELNTVLGISTINIIGINNRDLEDFTVDKSIAEKLIPMIPKDRTIVVESGIKAYEDIKIYRDLSVNTFLIGESLMKAGNIKAKLKDFLGER